MTMFVRHSGAWVEVLAGKLRVKESPDNPLLRDFTPDLWVSPTKVYAKSNSQWADTGYMPAVGTPGTPTLQSWSVDDPISIEVQWAVPLTGVTPTSYNVALYTQGGTKLAGQTVLPPVDVIQPPRPGYPSYTRESRPPSATFSNSLTSGLFAAGANYYVVVTGTADGAADGVSAPLKVRIGSAVVTRQETTYGWSAAEGLMRPTFTTQTSQYSDMGGANSVDPGDPAYGATAPWTTAWVSTGRSAQNGLWEGLEYSMPNANRLMTKVGLVTEPAHSLYLGVKANGAWVGPITAASLGLPANFLSHNYAQSNLGHTSNIRWFDVEALGLKFSDINALAIAVSGFVNLYGTPGTAGTVGTAGTAGQTTTTDRTIPPGYSMEVRFNKSLYLLRDGTSSDFLSSSYWGDGGLPIVYSVTPSPPGSAVWPAVSSGHTRSYRLEYWGEQDVRYRVTDNGVAMSGADAYLKYSSGAIIKVTRAVFDGKLGQVTSTTPGTAGTPGTPGTAAVPAWRARIQDFNVSYKDWVATGTRTVVDAAQIDTVSGPTAW